MSSRCRPAMTSFFQQMPTPSSAARRMLRFLCWPKSTSTAFSSLISGFCSEPRQTEIFAEGEPVDPHLQSPQLTWYHSNLDFEVKSHAATVNYF